MNDEQKDFMERQVKASLAMMKWAKEGKPLEEQWQELGRMGFNEKQRVDIAKCLSAFMRHRQGDHSICPPTCSSMEYMSENHEFESSRHDIRGMIDEVDKLHEMNNQRQFSDDVLEEWK